MTWSLQNQMLLPLAIFVAMLIFIISFNQAALQVKQEGNQAIQVYIEIAHKLSSVPHAESQSILQEYKRLYPKWNFVVVENSQLKYATLKLNSRKEQILSHLPAAPDDLAGHDALLLASNGNWYYVSPIMVPGWDSHSYLVCLEPHQSIASTITGVYRRSSWLAFGISGILVFAAAVYSSRLSHRVIRIQKQVHRVAAGDVSQMADERGHDEISELAKSVNIMASELESMKLIVKNTERARLHAQLAGGIAHELRNGIHTARLSLEMFQEVGDTSLHPSQSMLINAQEQLTMTEALVRRLLTLGKPQKQTMIPQGLKEILVSVSNMLYPISHHAEVEFRTEIDETLDWTAKNSESMQATFINLCMNAVEAAGRHGDVCLTARTIDNEIQIQISDSGSGPAAEIAETLFEPFTTTKPEGIGLGLQLVQQAIADANGTVDWRREQERTIFTVRLQKQTQTVEMDHNKLLNTNDDEG
ncbi:MAG: HAMP domain-containing sensor histidine kinase [Gimesia sp.]